MNTVADSNMDSSLHTLSFRKGLCFVFSPLPVPFVNFVLSRLVRAIKDNRPEIFNRLEGHHHKWFLIDPVNLPFALCLRPDPIHPVLKACRRHSIPKSDGRISGSFLTLLGMIDGRYDGDALFFTRDLCVEGDTEAVVCLRNALDDVDGSIADDVAAFFGVPGRRFLKIARKVSAHVHRK
jgi:predicted lipid carrier protein YhbT